jgi:hypothetical protein
MHGQSGSVQGRAGLSRRNGPDMWMLTPTVVRFSGRVERGRRLSLVTMAVLCFFIIAQESDYLTWPGYSHSIFVDGVCSTLFPQTDVWPRCHCVDLVPCSQPGGRRERPRAHHPPPRRVLIPQRSISVVQV